MKRWGIRLACIAVVAPICGCSTPPDRTQSALDGAFWGGFAGDVLGCVVAANVGGIGEDFGVGCAGVSRLAHLSAQR